MNWLDKATQLLNSVDSAAGERIKEVKEATGIHTPAVAPADQGVSSSSDVIVVLSAAAAALLEPEDRERLIASGTARIADDDTPSSTPAAPSLVDSSPDGQQQQRRIRVAEWSALQQELMIVNMHGRKLQSRLAAVGQQLAQARVAEATAKRQLLEASSARSAAEHAATEARGSIDERLTAAQARAAAAEAAEGAALVVRAEPWHRARAPDGCFLWRCEGTGATAHASSPPPPWHLAHTRSMNSRKGASVPGVRCNTAEVKICISTSSPCDEDAQQRPSEDHAVGKSSQIRGHSAAIPPARQSGSCCARS